VAALEWRANWLVAAANELAVRPAGWLDGLKALDYRAAHGALDSLPGVGPKIADCVALFALGKDEAVPVDTHVWQLAVRFFAPELRGRSLTAAAYERIAGAFRARYGAYAGWAQAYLYYEDVLRHRGRPER
jgi:N-glycosylase/DNA lyase